MKIEYAAKFGEATTKEKKLEEMLKSAYAAIAQQPAQEQGSKLEFEAATKT